MKGLLQRQHVLQLTVLFLFSLVSPFLSFLQRLWKSGACYSRAIATILHLRSHQLSNKSVTLNFSQVLDTSLMVERGQHILYPCFSSTLQSLFEQLSLSQTWDSEKFVNKRTRNYIQEISNTVFEAWCINNFDLTLVSFTFHLLFWLQNCPLFLFFTAPSRLGFQFHSLNRRQQFPNFYLHPTIIVDRSISTSEISNSPSNSIFNGTSIYVRFLKSGTLVGVMFDLVTNRMSIKIFNYWF